MSKVTKFKPKSYYSVTAKTTIYATDDDVLPFHTLAIKCGGEFHSDGKKYSAQQRELEFVFTSPVGATAFANKIGSRVVEYELRWCPIK